MRSLDEYLGSFDGDVARLARERGGEGESLIRQYHQAQMRLRDLLLEMDGLMGRIDSYLDANGYNEYSDTLPLDAKNIPGAHGAYR